MLFVLWRYYLQTLRQGLRRLDDAARAKDCFEICDDRPDSRPLFARTVLVDGEVRLSSTCWLQGVWIADGDRDRQRHPVLLGQGLVRAEEAVPVVAPARHPDGTHSPGASRTEWPSRAHAPHAQDRSDQTGGRQRPAAAGALRHLRRSLQPRAAAPGRGDACAGAGLHTFPRPYRGLGHLSARSSLANRWGCVR